MLTNLVETLYDTVCWHKWRRKRIYYKFVTTGTKFSYCFECDTKYINPHIPKHYKWRTIHRSTSPFSK